jgi:hypothetical protein
MTPRLVGGIAAATFAIGILTGAAGTIVARDATTPRTDFAAVMADHMDDVSTASMMSGGMMSGSMMGPGSSFGPGMTTGPVASAMPGSLHDQHHPAASQDGAK